MTKEKLSELIAVYGKAWESQDADLILTIFAENATYADRFYEEPHRNHTGIKKYWQYKVIGEQRNIRFQPMNLWIEGVIGISEFEAEFDGIKRGIHVLMRGVLIMELGSDKIVSLREYWQSKK